VDITHAIQSLATLPIDQAGLHYNRSIIGEYINKSKVPRFDPLVENVLFITFSRLNFSCGTIFLLVFLGWVDLW